MTKTPFAMLSTVFVTALFLAPATSADHCDGTYVAVTVASQTVYFVSDGNDPGRTDVYLESNGEPGLQEGGPGPLDGTPIFGSTNPCGHANPDTRVL